MYVKKYQFFFLGYYLLGILVILVSDSILADKYFYDSERIADLVRAGEREWGGAYAGNATLYSILGFGYVVPREVVGIINYTAALAVLHWIYRTASPAWSPAPLAWFAVWAILIALYLGMYSKELFTFLVSAIMLWFCRSRRIFPLLCVAAVFVSYGAFVRQYWLLIFGLFCVFYVVLLLPVGGLTRTMVSAAALLALSFAVVTATGVYLTDTRLLLNLHRIGSEDARTMIFNPLVNTSPIHDVANNVSAWIRFLIPLSVVRFGAFQHIAFAFWQVANVVLALIVIFRTGRTRDGDAVHDGLRREVLAILAYVLAFTYVHSAFEGDFGSYLRHQTALLPVYFYLIVRGWTYLRRRVPRPPVAFGWGS